MIDDLVDATELLPDMTGKNIKLFNNTKREWFLGGILVGILFVLPFYLIVL